MSDTSDSVPEILMVSLDQEEIPIQLKKKDGTIIGGILRELSGPDRAAYISLMQKKMRIVDGKPAGLVDYNGVETELLKRALLDKDGKPMDPNFINTLPSRALRDLFAKAQQLSGLDATAEERLKNV